MNGVKTIKGGDEIGGCWVRGHLQDCLGEGVLASSKALEGKMGSGWSLELLFRKA